MRQPASTIGGGDAARRRAAVRRPRTRARAAADEVGAGGEPGDEAVDGVHGELVLDQLDDEGERGAGVAGVAVGGLALGLVGERGLVAVVPVGDHDRLLGHRGGDGGAACRVVDAPDGVAHAVLVDDVGQRRVARPAGGR